MLSDKLRCVLNTGAEICTANDNSCLMQIGGALSRQRTGVRCLHLAEILAGTRRRIERSCREAATAPDFPKAAKQAIANTQLRHNVRHATDVIRAKRARVVDEIPDWEQLRDAGHAIKAHTLRHLDFYLKQFETACKNAGGHVHWARDADEANDIIVGLIRQYRSIGSHQSEDDDVR